MEMNKLINKLIELTQCDEIKWNKSHNHLFWLSSTEVDCYLSQNLVWYKLEFKHMVCKHWYWDLNKNLLKELWSAAAAQYKRRTDAEDIEALKEIFALECPDTRLKKKKRLISEENLPPALPYTDEAAAKVSKGLFEK